MHTRSLFRTLVAVLPLAVLLLMGAGAAPQRPSAELKWYTMEEAYQMVASNPANEKKVLVDMYTDWCGWCKRMDATTFHNPEVVAYVQEHYIPVKMDAETRETITIGGKAFTFQPNGRRGTHELAALIGNVDGKMAYPTLVFLNERFQLIQALQGYQSPEGLMPILTYLGEDRFADQSFEDFLEEWNAQHGGAPNTPSNEG